MIVTIGYWEVATNLYQTSAEEEDPQTPGTLVVAAAPTSVPDVGDQVEDSVIKVAPEQASLPGAAAKE